MVKSHKTDQHESLLHFLVKAMTYHRLKSLEHKVEMKFRSGDNTIDVIDLDKKDANAGLDTDPELVKKAKHNLTVLRIKYKKMLDEYYQEQRKKMEQEKFENILTNLELVYQTEKDILSIAETGEDLEGNLILAQIAYRDMSYWEDIANNTETEAERQRIN